jgi:hypothetical protein
MGSLVAMSVGLPWLGIYSLLGLHAVVLGACF